MGRQREREGEREREREGERDRLVGRGQKKILRRWQTE